MIIVFLFLIILCVAVLVIVYLFKFFGYVLKSLKLDVEYRSKLLDELNKLDSKEEKSYYLTNKKAIDLFEVMKN